MNQEKPVSLRSRLPIRDSWLPLRFSRAQLAGALLLLALVWVVLVIRLCFPNA
jgi:hypothetical protein